MKFILTRTSGFGRDEDYNLLPLGPGYGAVMTEVTRYDRRNTDDPAKVTAYKGQTRWWYDHGTNHRVENGCIVRDMGKYTIPVIDPPDLDALMAFVAKYGPVVISPARDEEFPTLEIYDDYRE